MTDEQATPAHFFHPLFAGMVPSLIDAPCASTFQRLAQGLGFMSTCLRLNLGGSDEPAMAQPWIEGGYRMAARWPAGNATVLVYLKPTTVFAEAIWLAGLGVIEQAAPLETFYGYNAERGEEDYTCSYSTREEACQEGNQEAIDRGRRTFETCEFQTRRASNYLCNVLDSMGEQAYEDIGEAAEDWPVVRAGDDPLELQRVVCLLVDGWASATGNQSKFGAAVGDSVTHDVFDPRSLAP